MQLKLPTIGKRSIAISSTMEENAHIDSSREGVFTTGHSSTSFLNDPTKVRVLIVEDSASIAKMMTRWLEKNDCVVHCASNGKIGLEMLKETQFDIMFLDFLMVRDAASIFNRILLMIISFLRDKYDFSR